MPFRPSNIGAVVVAAALAGAAASPASAQLHFATSRTFPCGGGPVATVRADWNEDGRLDFAVLLRNETGFGWSVTLFLGDPVSGFRAVAGPSGAGDAVDIEAADFDRDGHADWAVLTRSALAVALGDGSGAFSLGVAVGTRTFETSLHVLEANGDGIADLAVISGFEGGGFVDVHTGDGLGGLDSAPRATVVSGMTGGAAFADFDEDGASDVVVTTGDARVDVLRGDGSGLFSAAGSVSLPPASRPLFVLARDWSGDGHADLVVGLTNPAAVEVFLGDGRATFAPVSRFDIAPFARGASAQDVDGDGVLDLLIHRQEALDIFMYAGGGTFAPLPPIYTWSTVVAASCPDVDGDAVPDLVIIESASSCEGSLALRRGIGGGSFMTSPLAGAPGDIIAAADVNGDGIQDVLKGERRFGYVFILPSNGIGGFGSAVMLPTPYSNGLEALGSADFDLDGVADLVTVGWSGTFVRRGLGGLAFDVPLFVSAEHGRVIATGDVDGNGFPDILIVASTGIATPLLRLANGTFVPAPTFVAGGALSIALADLDGDSRLDAAIGRFGDPDVVLFRGDGRGGFAGAGGLDTDDADVYGTASGVVVADFDGDGRSDVAIAHERSSAPCRRGGATVFFGTGTPWRFESARRLGASLQVTGVAADDADADGYTDLIALGQPLGFTVFSCGPSREFDASPHFGALGTIPVATDLDRDGLVDVVSLAPDGPNLFSGATPILNRLDALPEASVRRGNVNERAGAAANVLLLNGSPGTGPLRRVHVRTADPFRLGMRSSPALRPGPARFALFSWTAKPDRGTLLALPGGVGTIALDPRRAALRWNNTGQGAPGRPSLPAPSVVFDRPLGLGRAVDIYIQGVIADPNSPSGRFAVTNGIEIRVR